MCGGLQHSQVPAENGKCAFPGWALNRKTVALVVINYRVLQVGRITPSPIYPGGSLHQSCMDEKQRTELNAFKNNTKLK